MIHKNLVKKAINGDEAAFETLIKQESDKLYKTAFLYVRNKEDALDVLQETVYKAYVSMGQLQKPKYFSTWLTKILIRTAYECLNKQKKAVLTDVTLLDNVSEDNSQNIEQQLDLADAISSLDQHYQTVIILFYYHDLSIRSIADAMEKPEGTIKTYLRRAKIELKKLLEGVNQYGQRMV